MFCSTIVRQKWEMQVSGKDIIFEEHFCMEVKFSKFRDNGDVNQNVMKLWLSHKVVTLRTVFIYFFFENEEIFVQLDD